MSRPASKSLPRAPMALFGALLALGALSAAITIFAALVPDWLGVGFAPAPEGRDGLVIASIAPAGPADGRLAPGWRVLEIGADSYGNMPLAPEDILDEPDVLPSTEAMQAFFARQGRISRMVDGGMVYLRGIKPDGTSFDHEVRTRPFRPISDLPAVFWVQIAVGLAGVWLGGWVLSLRPRDPAAGFLLLAGVGLMVSSHAAALYSTRELALPQGVFAFASMLNALGAKAFGVGMLCLFLIYPVRLAGRRALLAVVAVFALWGALWAAWALPDPVLGTHVPIAVLLLLIFAAAIAQIPATRGNPAARAALRWFGLSVTLGAGGFVATIIAPSLLGLPHQMSQGYAFLFFLIIYGGLALGVARYRLFELEDWSFRILFYAGGAALLIALDAGLIYAVALDRAPALGASLLAVALVYMPARDAIARRLRPGRDMGAEDLFARITDVALTPPGDDQHDRMHALLSAMFDPLQITEAPAPVDAPTLVDCGEAMDLPGLDRLSSVRMAWAGRGRRLFSTRDLARARSALAMLSQLIESRRAYEAGVAEERQRINRDMHDNIGVQLLGALHSPAPARKDALIRRTLTELRDIISNPVQSEAPLGDLLADARAEIGEHFDAMGIALTWREDGLRDETAPPAAAAALRAILREGANNILRHSGATSAVFTLGLTPGGGGRRVSVTIADDGVGAAPGLPGGGAGLTNLRTRTEGRGGAFAIGPGPDGRGCEVRAELPLDLAIAGPDAEQGA